jgi:imidazolonepropionase-like amidohydrolase
MTLNDIIDQLGLKLLVGEGDLSTLQPAGGYTSDLLSCVMAGAKKNSIWVTLQAHVNVVAVAALLELAAVIITEGVVPDADTLSKARDEGVILLGTELKSFEVCGRLWEMGLRPSTD